VLGLVVTTHLYETFTGMPEGELAKVRASVVSAAAMAEVAAETGLGEQMRLGKGEAASGGRAKLSILADGMEAVIGAVYLDQGWPAAQGLVLRVLGDRIDTAAEGPGGHDFKTQLQELVAREFEQLPEYELRDEGPDHEKRFFAIVRVVGEIEGEGEGRSKKLAEQAAARTAWLRLSERVASVTRADRLGPTHPANLGPSDRPKPEPDLDLSDRAVSGQTGADDPGSDLDLSDEGVAGRSGTSPSDSTTVPPVTPTGPTPAQPAPAVTGGSRESETHDA
jgi:ribonuclease-3